MSRLKKRKNKFNNRRNKGNNRCNVGNKSNKFKNIDTPRMFRGIIENGVIKPYIPNFIDNVIKVENREKVSFGFFDYCKIFTNSCITFVNRVFNFR